MRFHKQTLKNKDLGLGPKHDFLILYELHLFFLLHSLPLYNQNLKFLIFYLDIFYYTYFINRKFFNEA